MIIRNLLLPLLLLIGGCADKHDDSIYWNSSTTRYVSSGYSKHLTKLLERIDAGDDVAWSEFKKAGKDVDGEHSQTYSVACSELLRRDPTFFLRKYLFGDDESIECGRLGYEWSGDQGRLLMDEIYARRLYIADSKVERDKIMRFIYQTAYKE
jgi:hypothetical protein